MISDSLLEKTGSAVERFCAWLDRHGELSYDHQSFFAGPVGRRAKALYYRKPLLGTAAVAPMIFLEAFLPSGRKLFWKPQRFPIADAHYAMGFTFLAGTTGADGHYRRAVHFLKILEQTRCKDYEDFAWGYPFDWETRTGTMKAETPLITTVPYVYEAFSQMHALDNDPQWLGIMRSIAEHAFRDYRDLEMQPGMTSCAYSPEPDAPCGIVNASAYRAYLLTRAGLELSVPPYLKAAEKNLNFVLASQNQDGSWHYSTDGQRDFVDHFHTCFVLKALAKIEELTGCVRCHAAIERGASYYLKNLFDANGLPLPFSRAPRLTVYRRELYDYAECINLGVLLSGRFPEFDRTMAAALADLFERWQQKDGSFRARELMLGWDNVPMHRWAQSQLFRSLCFLLARKPEGRQTRVAHRELPASPVPL